MLTVLACALPYYTNPTFPPEYGVCVVSDGDDYTYIGYAPEIVQEQKDTPSYGHPFWDFCDGSPALNQSKDLPPFQTGWMGFLGYEMLHTLEKQSAPPRPSYADYPHAWMGYYPAVVALDHRKKQAWAMASGMPETEPEAWQQLALTRIETISRQYHQTAQITVGVAKTPRLTPSISEKTYCAMVEQTREAILDGTLYQLNIAQHFSAPYSQNDLTNAYHHMGRQHPAPHRGFLHLGSTVLLSTSPELFFNLTHDGILTTRPMKGTRKRDLTNAALDQALKNDLYHSPKDRAENLMIVDLMRHDMAKICEAGSVHVQDLWAIESYTYVHQMTSHLTAKVRTDIKKSDVFRALFPSGSVTGAPKIQAMDMITRLEPMARGPFCGSMGYISATGAMQFNVLIRTLVWSNNTLHLHTGCGIVADSNAGAEYQESLDKTGFWG